MFFYLVIYCGHSGNPIFSKRKKGKKCWKCRNWISLKNRKIKEEIWGRLRGWLQWAQLMPNSTCFYTPEITLMYKAGGHLLCLLIVSLLKHSSLCCFLTQGLPLVPWEFAQCMQDSLIWWKMNGIEASNKYWNPKYILLL